MSYLSDSPSSVSGSSIHTNSTDERFWPPYDGALCKVCFCFDWDHLERRPGHSRSYLTLTRSARDGCYTCRILEKAIVALYEIKKPSMVRFGFCVRTYGKNHYNPGNKQEPDMYPEFKLWIVGGPNMGGIDLYKAALGPCPWRFLEEKHHIPESTASLTSYSWVEGQMERCLSQHPKCGASSDSPLLPTRVVDVGLEPASNDSSNNNVKVLETKGLRGKYLTLSHCWGDPALMPTKLTVHTLKEYRDKIPYDSLPRTFQHAVTVARKSKVQYLWIDSLCIIQKDDDKDSPEDKEVSRNDWEHESRRMCSVYENSYLTLAGVSSASCTGGLFFNTRPLEINGTNVDGPYQIFARKEIKHYAPAFPLLKRGWANQEHLLSPRTLLCGEDELMWHCREHKACQCSTDPKGGLDSRQMKLPKVDQLEMQSTRAELIKMWHTIITDYSNTSLTYQTDKLAAIDGIAQYMRTVRKCEYLAGLWEDSLPFDLLWSIDTLGRTSKRTIQVDPPPIKTPWSSDKWLFPTWSWASVQGKVVWWWMEHFIEDCPPEAFLVKRIKEHPTTGQGPSTARNAHQLRLCGVLVPSTLDIVSTALNRKVTYYPDLDNRSRELGPDAKVDCLRVLKLKNHYFSLVLLCVDGNKKVYERLGLLIFDDEGVGSYRLPDGRYGGISWSRNVVRGLPPWWEVSKGWKGEEIEITLV